MNKFPLQEIYDKLPKINCQGLCYGECTGLIMTPLEVERMTRAGGKAPALTAEDSCNYLDAEHRCSIYEARPLVCRLYGVTERLQCPHGCVPERMLGDPEAKMVRFLAAMIGGEEVCNFNQEGLQRLIDAVNRGEIIP